MHNDVITVEYKDDTLFIHIDDGEDIELPEDLIEGLNHIFVACQGEPEEEIVKRMDEFMESMGFHKVGEIDANGIQQDERDS